MAQCVKCKKPIVFPAAPRVYKHSERKTKRIAVTCPHCGTVNIREVGS